MPVLTASARRYLVEHAIDTLTVAELGITEHNGRLRYPNGRMIAVNGHGPKALQPKGTPLALWWPTGELEDGATVLVCEGESDALAALSTIRLSEIEHQGRPDDPLAGITVAAIPGVGYPTTRLAEDLVGTVAVLAFDGDSAGRVATARATEVLHGAGIACHDLDMPDGMDLASCLAALDPKLRAPWLAGRIDDARPVELNHGLEPNVEGVVVGDLRDYHYHPPAEQDRYDGRVVDLDALLAKPPEPIPWRVHDIVADGTLTIISGESGAGKSWLAQALCTGVARGHAVAGLLCAKGKALYIDAEMGPRMFVDQRLRPTGVKTAEFAYIDAMGLDISTPGDLAWVRGEIERTGAHFVVIDSLRRLTPSKSENDSDDMAPAVSALAKLARDTNAAIVLVHHKGDSEKFFRGSTAIKDQADALFALLRDPDDEHAPRRLRCRGGRGKMRYAPEPPDIYLDINPEEGGVAGSDPPEDTGPQVPIREAVATAIAAALPAKTKKEVADKIGRRADNKTFRDAWEDLERAGGIVQINGGWAAGGGGLPLGNTTTTSRLRVVEGSDDPGVA